MKTLIEEHKEFQFDAFGSKGDLFNKLRHGQRLEALLITCSDSFLVPTFLTTFKPGGLFIVRNAGNLVPKNVELMSGNMTTIEFAIAAIMVKDIVVCGHSDCESMKALLASKQSKDLSRKRKWFLRREMTHEVRNNYYSNSSDETLLNAKIHENVLIQLDNLRTHPTIASRLKEKTLHLHGWVYSDTTGELWSYDPGEGRFFLLDSSDISGMCLANS